LHSSPRTPPLAIFAALFLVMAQVATAQTTSAAPRPNIVLVLVDDLGWSDVSYHGGPIATPNIDAIAEAGIELDRFYATRACTYTRVALMTARHPYEFGMHHNVLPFYTQTGLPSDVTTLPMVLKGAGYQTFALGKWHLGFAAPEYWPTRRGFDHFYGHLSGRIDYFTHQIEGHDDWRLDETQIKEQGYATDLIADRAASWIAKAAAQDTPFFAYIAFNAPHSPWQAPAHLIADGPAETLKQRTYDAMVTSLDQAVGKIYKQINDLGIAQNTLFVFQSDNGGAELRHPNPLRGRKGSFYDGGARVVAFAAWPGTIAAQQSGVALRSVDLPAIFAALAGSSFPDQPRIEGRGDPALLGIGGAAQTDPQPMLIDYGPDGASVLKGNTKLVVNGDLAELFDIAADPAETRDIAAQFPDDTAELLAVVEAIRPAPARFQVWTYRGRDVTPEKLFWKMPQTIGEAHSLHWRNIALAGIAAAMALGGLALLGLGLRHVWKGNLRRKAG